MKSVSWCATPASASLPKRRRVFSASSNRPTKASLGEAAQAHAPKRIVMFTPAARHELQAFASSPFTGYLVKPLRATSLAARLLAPPEVVAPNLAADSLPEAVDRGEPPAPAPVL